MDEELKEKKFFDEKIFNYEKIKDFIKNNWKTSLNKY